MNGHDKTIKLGELMRLAANLISEDDPRYNQGIVELIIDAAGLRMIDNNRVLVEEALGVRKIWPELEEGG